MKLRTHDMKPSEFTADFLQRLAAGDQQAFRALFDRFYPRAVRFLEDFTHDQDTAEDLAQDLFVKLWLHREMLPGIRSLNSYIYQMARNAAINSLRTRGRNVPLTAAPEPSDPVLSEEEYYMREKQLLIDLTVEQLPEKCRKVFQLSRMEGLDNDEIARRLAITKKTVENHLNIALKRIRATLDHVNGILL